MKNTTFKPGFFRDLRFDAVAGLTTAVMLIPQAMAYAILAGLPPIVGLYAAALPLLGYALIGSSRVLAVGPVAMDSLLTAATVGVFAASGTQQYLELAALLALMVGLLQVVLGVLRGGVLVNFLSGPVISGFTSAAALIIGASQLKTLLGIEMPRTSSIFSTLSGAAARMHEVHVPTLAIAVSSVVGLWAFKRFLPRVPRALVIVAVAAVTVYLGNLADLGVKVIGDVPSGLPRFVLPSFELETLQNLAPGALTIAMVAFMEGISISSKLASQTGHRVDANREFSALGVANVIAGLFGGYPVAGGLSRTAVNADAGAKSKLAGVITALAVLASLLWFTPLLYPIPRAALGAIIVMAVLGLFDWKEAVSLWKTNRSDFSVMLATFAATLVLGIQQGILIGVGISILLVVLHAAKPNVVELAEVPGTPRFDLASEVRGNSNHAGLLIARVDARLFFANTAHVRAKLLELEKPGTHTLILVASGINGIDTSAMRGLAELLRDYQRRDIQFVLAGVKAPVLRALQASGLREQFGEHGVFDSVQQAVRELAA